MKKSEKNDDDIKIVPGAEQRKLKELLEKIPEELLAEVLAEKISEDSSKGVKRMIKAASISEHFSGPIPPPKILNQYEGVHEGLANRIVSMAEKEQNHRHGIETLAVKGEINKDKRGQTYAIIASLSIIIGSMILIYLGHDKSGSFLVGSTLTGLAYIFITGRKPRTNKKNHDILLEHENTKESNKNEQEGENK